jgi:hypothetical protein
VAQLYPLEHWGATLRRNCSYHDWEGSKIPSLSPFFLFFCLFFVFSLFSSFFYKHLNVYITWISTKPSITPTEENITYIHKYAYNIYLYIAISANFMIIGKLWESIIILKHLLIYEVRCSSNNKDCFTDQFIWSSFCPIFETTLYTPHLNTVYTALKSTIYIRLKLYTHTTLKHDISRFQVTIVEVKVMLRLMVGRSVGQYV